MKPLLLILALAVSGLAQKSPEFGDISEIAGMTKVYVISEDLEARARIVTELKKREPLFEIVSDTSQAEFAISYGWSGVTTRGPIGMVRTNAYKGDLIVSTRGKADESNNRIVWRTQVSRKTTLSKNPADKAVERFVKDYKAARGALKPLDPPFGTYEKKP